MGYHSALQPHYRCNHRLTALAGRLGYTLISEHSSALALFQIVGNMYVYLSPTSDESRPLIGQLTRVYDLLSPTSGESRPLIGRLQGIQVLSPVYHSVWRCKPRCNWYYLLPVVNQGL